MSNKMEIIEHSNSNQTAMHSLMVMEQWGNGEAYNEDRWIERGRQAMRQTVEGMFELGRVLIVLKEHMTWEKFADVCEVFGMSARAAQQLTQATRRFATPQMQKAQSKLMELGKSKLLELLVEEDEAIVDLADGGDINGHTLDDVERMTVRELRAALRESRETAEAKDKIIADKNKKVDELAEKLAKKQTGKEPSPEDVGSELTMQLSSLEVAARSDLSRFAEVFEQMLAHGEANGYDHRPQMVAAINQIIRDAETLRERFTLPQEAPTNAKPEWLDGE
ncbi:hypothetical protein A7P96_03295 [Eikenella sp. NML03-A-027]|uniref:hypothetical protein n=1 Tax=Eikenella sp. NML03-A-027 TaxID=1795828 RepID=UPI0007DF061E|nr:hypothetical protein [Eikenella sp. NML03-A-027]OAM32323.1 hypothetical protein A7P96_03295 [Eikenella sp. NML03-A-027]